MPERSSNRSRLRPWRVRLGPGALIACLALMAGLQAAAAQETSSHDDRLLSLSAGGQDHDVGIALPSGWSVAPQVFENAQSLVDVPPGELEAPTAHVQVFVEPRLDHDDALRQIREFCAAVTAEEMVFLDVGGWPAVRTTRVEWRPQSDKGPKYPDPRVLRIQTHIAFGSMLVIVTGNLPLDASDQLIETTREISSSLRFASRGDPDLVEREIQQLRKSLLQIYRRSPSTEEPPPSGSGGFAEPSWGADDRINANGFGELEIAVSPDGQNVVVALQSRRFVSSNDGGATFPNSGTIGSGNGDPSIAYAQSGSFYIAWIDTNCGTNYQTFNVGALPPQPFGYDCTGMSQSTDNGVSFQTNTVNPAVVCIGRAPSGMMDPAGACFPDQEHIAADRVNAGGGGGDQVYSTWRNFNSANQDAGLVCSQDSGVNWTAPITLGPSSFFPRITVGQDGFVYVAAYGGGNYRLWKYNSCANGLGLVAGFPVNVAARTPYVCPFAGHDRCDQNPSSQTVAVDDTNPNHVYYAFAQDDGAANSDSNVWVRDSLDGGSTWPAARVIQANPPVPARRVMPWMSTTGGDAVLTWYEQSDPVPTDRTEHVGSHIGLDAANNLTLRDVFVISDLPDNWCNIGWPCSTRVAPGASESCPAQPQLAGRCGDGDSTTPDSGIACDFSDEAAVPGTYCPQPFAGSGNNESCLGGGGCPKYGDYNGNAAVGGKLFAAWPSANAPPGIPPPSGTSNPGVLFDVVNLDELQVPVITVPGSVRAGEICDGEVGFATLEVCNTGGDNLQVDVISSDDPDFAVTIPSSGYPVTISPDFCFPFEVSFTPSGSGDDTAVLTIPSDDPSRPVVEVAASGIGEDAAIVTVFDADYGNVCLGDTATHDLLIQNSGGCELSVSGITSSNSEFDLATVMTFPLSIAPGGEVTVPVEFAPTGDTTAESSTISLTHDGANTASPKQITASGTSEDAVIHTFLANAGAFGEVCAGDLHDLDLTVSNDGACPLEIESVSIVLGANSQAGDFEPPSGAAGAVVEPGNAVLFPVRFSPSMFDGEPPAVRQAQVDVAGRTLNASSSLALDSTPISGVVPPPDINLALANSGDFGAVCKTDQSDLALTLFNQGRCDLSILAIDLVPDAGSFELPANLTLPLVLSPDADFTVPVRFSPDMCFDLAEMRTVKVTSNDPDEMMVNVDVSGVAPCPSLVIDPVGLTGLAAFPATVVDTGGTLGCYAERGLSLRNSSECPLTISSISAAGADFLVTSPTVYPILLPGGEETLGVTVRFLPQSDSNPVAPSEVTGQLTIMSDDPDGDGLADLCGESVAQSGVRILVVDQSGSPPVPIDNVDDMRIQSHGIHTPGPINLHFTDQPLSSAVVCGNTIDYHVDQESLPATGTTGNDPNSSYKAKAKEGNLQSEQSFPLGQCEFRQFQLQLDDGDSGNCVLLPRGAPCANDGECCSGQCTGPAGGKTCN